MNGGAEQAMKILSATVPLGRRFRVDAPPAWQIFSDQDDADGTPDAGDAVDSAISSLRFGKELVYGCSNRISMSDA